MILPTQVFSYIERHKSLIIWSQDSAILPGSMVNLTRKSNIFISILIVYPADRHMVTLSTGVAFCMLQFTIKE